MKRQLWPCKGAALVMTLLVIASYSCRAQNGTVTSDIIRELSLTWQSLLPEEQPILSNQPGKEKIIGGKACKASEKVLMKHPVAIQKNLFHLKTAREQSNKGIGAVADAMFYARSLGRTFVEPAVKNSRIVDPKTPGAHPLSWYYNITEHENYVHILPLAYYRKICAYLTASKLVVYDNPILNKRGGVSFQTEEQVRSFFRDFKSDVIVVDGLWRSSGVSHKYPSTMHPDVPRFHVSAFVRRTASQILEKFGRPVACANWRTETAPATKPGADFGLVKCAAVFSESVAVKAAAAAKLRKQADGTKKASSPSSPAAQHSILLSTDLFPGNSDTYHRNNEVKAALKVVERSLGESLNVPLMQRIGNISDSGLRAFVEARICARSDIMIRCARKHGEFCTNCVKQQSGYLSFLEWERNGLGKSATSWGHEWTQSKGTNTSTSTSTSTSKNSSHNPVDADDDELSELGGDDATHLTRSAYH